MAGAVAMVVLIWGDETRVAVQTKQQLTTKPNYYNSSKHEHVLHGNGRLRGDW